MLSECRRLGNDGNISKEDLEIIVIKLCGWIAAISAIFLVISAVFLPWCRRKDPDRLKRRGRVWRNHSLVREGLTAPIPAIRDRLGPSGSDPDREYGDRRQPRRCLEGHSDGIRRGCRGICRQAGRESHRRNGRKGHRLPRGSGWNRGGRCPGRTDRRLGRGLHRRDRDGDRRALLRPLGEWRLRCDPGNRSMISFEAGFRP